MSNKRIFATVLAVLVGTTVCAGAVYRFWQWALGSPDWGLIGYFATIVIVGFGVAAILDARAKRNPHA